MKICRFDGNRMGLVDGDMIRDVTAILGDLPSFRWPLPLGDVFIAKLEGLKGMMERLARKAEALAIDRVRLRSPVANPSKIIGRRSITWITSRRRSATGRSGRAIN
jgi:hypothetical protein